MSIDELARELDRLAGSRWVHALERVEAPVRIVRPGSGTVRARIEALARAARRIATTHSDPVANMRS